MAFVTRRLFSSTAVLRNLKPSVATPAPLSREAILSTPELRNLQAKAAGSWKELSKVEVVQLYKATFPLTFKEIKSHGKGDGFKVVVGVAVGVTIGVFLARFLSQTVGPERPHTFNNKQWEEDTRKKLLRQKSNPIEGISSRVKA